LQSFLQIFTLMVVQTEKVELGHLKAGNAMASLLQFLS
jgi:hypothetical protein